MSTGYNYRIETSTPRGWQYTGYNVPVADAETKGDALRIARAKMKLSGDNELAESPLRAIRE